MLYHNREDVIRFNTTRQMEMTKTEFHFKNHTSYLRPGETHCNRPAADRDILNVSCWTVKSVHVVSMGSFGKYIQISC